MRHRGIYTYHLGSDEPPTNNRERLGSWLRKIADRIDGRRTLTVTIDSFPALSHEIEEDVVAKGIDHMRRCLKDAVEDECREALYRSVLPAFFKDRTHC